MADERPSPHADAPGETNLHDVPHLIRTLQGQVALLEAKVNTLEARIHRLEQKP
jgi:hypothetical protein